MELLLSSQRSQAYVLRFTLVMWLRVAAIWNHIRKSIVQPLFSLSGCLFFSSSAFLVFCLPSILHFIFFLFFSLSTAITVWWVPVCPCVWGLLAGLLGLLAMGASYTQLNAVVKNQTMTMSGNKEWTAIRAKIWPSYCFLNLDFLISPINNYYHFSAAPLHNNNSYIIIIL